MNSIIARIHITSANVEYRVVGRRICPERSPRAGRAKLHPYVWLTILFVLGGVMVAQTSIAVLKDDTHIIVAADSKVFQSDKLLCKIQHVGNVYWVMAGLMNSTSGYDVRLLAKTAIQKGKTIRGALDYFKATAPPLLQKELALDRRTMPQLYQRARQELGLEAAFFGIENGKPVVAYVSYHTSDNLDGSVAVSINQTGVLGSCENNARACGQLLGVRTRAMAYMQENRNWANDLSGTAAKIVSLEMEESPNFVGGPVSVLRVGTDGTYWIEPGTCKDTKQTAKRKRGR